jgi:hypothetical protein
MIMKLKEEVKAHGGYRASEKNIINSIYISLSNEVILPHRLCHNSGG